MEMQEWIEELLEMLQRDGLWLTTRGEHKAATYFATLAADIEGQIENWKEDEIWKE